MMLKRLIIATAVITAIALVAWSALAAPLGVREARFAAQGYETQTPTPGPSPTPSRTPTPTTTPIPFVLTPRPTSTALTPRPATPTPQTTSATPGPCTVVIGERSATCKTQYHQPVTWTLRITTTVADQRVVTSSLFDFTSRAVFSSELRPASIITVAPRWQGSRAISVITLTGQVSGSDWVSGTTLTGQAPAGATVTLIYYRWATATNSYRATFHSATANAQGAWAFTVQPPILSHKRDYWQIRHTAAGVTHVAGVLTRRMYFPIVGR